MSASKDAARKAQDSTAFRVAARVGYVVLGLLHLVIGAIAISIAFGAGELSGGPLTSSNGHLLVVVGFTADGDVVVNDPAADSPAGVRRTYDRAQLERVWLNASTGTSYVLRP